jgi:hypothetical protein
MSKSKFIILNRIGYGSNFNEISIDYENKLIKKKCISSYGEKKIIREINLYNYIIKNIIDFPIPKIHAINKTEYIMSFLEDYQPLYKIYKSLKNNKTIMNKISKNLSNLHSFEKVIIDKYTYIRYINIEIYEKLIDRYSTIKPIIEKYSYIKTVNNVEILPFFKLIELIKSEVYKIIESKVHFYLVPIHGDCQFNNILYNLNKDDAIFIDPRGYYGESNIFGIEEYDYAKIAFALSGYDEFDNRQIDTINIKKENIEISIHALDNKILQKGGLETLLMLSIWLGNSHCFINNENKVVYSYFIAVYLGSLYFNFVDPVI